MIYYTTQSSISAGGDGAVTDPPHIYDIYVTAAKINPNILPCTVVVVVDFVEVVVIAVVAKARVFESITTSHAPCRYMIIYKYIK